MDVQVLRKKTYPLGKILSITGAVGIFAGGLVLGYMYFYNHPLEEGATSPEIIIPEPEPEPAGAPTTTAPVVEEQKTFVEILSTPTGYLNVREGPGTNFKQVTRVKPGEAYELVSTNGEKTWHQIKLSATQSGWVAAQYVKVK